MHQRVPIVVDTQPNVGPPKSSAERLRRAKELMANYFPQPAPHVKDPIGKVYDIDDLRAASGLLAEGLPLPSRILSKTTHQKESIETNIKSDARASPEPLAQPSPPEKELIYEKLKPGLRIDPEWFVDPVERIPDIDIDIRFRVIPGPFVQRSPPCPRVGIPHTQWMDLESTTRRRLPRFLFRGFHPRSGGGYVGLNNEYGVTPLAFLNTSLVPTDMYGIPDLKGSIEGHLTNSWNIKTYFSSWAASFETALRFTDTSDGYVAIIDTSLIDDVTPIYHTPDLEAAGLSWSSYKDEYLAYGPVNGLAYHCVKVKDFLSDIRQLGIRELGGYSYTPQPNIAENHVATAKRIAERFRRPSDSRPDVVLFVTATLLSSRLGKHKPGPKIGDLLLSSLEGELEAYCRSPYHGLFNPETPISGQPLVGRTADMLNELERSIKRQHDPLHLLLK
ncbi:hypothetical protein DL771_003707 [Monosporascus sp. 5C6A]|nr:hypothetical protein DL771_003707 [Monosporascus sp. 5C6A]